DNDDVALQDGRVLRGSGHDGIQIKASRFLLAVRRPENHDLASVRDVLHAASAGDHLQQGRRALVRKDAGAPDSALKRHPLAVEFAYEYRDLRVLKVAGAVF